MGIESGGFEKVENSTTPDAALESNEVVIDITQFSIGSGLLSELAEHLSDSYHESLDRERDDFEYEANLEDSELLLTKEGDGYKLEANISFKDQYRSKDWGGTFAIDPSLFEKKNEYGETILKPETYQKLIDEIERLTNGK